MAIISFNNWVSADQISRGQKANAFALPKKTRVRCSLHKIKWAAALVTCNWAVVPHNVGTDHLGQGWASGRTPWAEQAQTFMSCNWAKVPSLGQRQLLSVRVGYRAEDNS